MFIKMFNIAFPTRYKVKLVDWDSSDRNSRNQGSSHVGAPARIKLGVLQGSWQFQSFLFDSLNGVQSCRHEIAETKCWSKVTQLMNVDQADWKSWDPRWWADQRQRKDLWVFLIVFGSISRVSLEVKCFECLPHRRLMLTSCPLRPN